MDICAGTPRPYEPFARGIPWTGRPLGWPIAIPVLPAACTLMGRLHRTLNLRMTVNFSQVNLCASSLLECDSLVDVFFVLPTEANAAPLQCVLEAGDAFFVPEGWGQVLILFCFNCPMYLRDRSAF